MSVQIRLATAEDIPRLADAGDELFDFALIPTQAARFFDDPHHHMMIAVEESDVVGMVSAFDYLHPDKPPTLFINEASVIEPKQRQGIGRKLIEAMVHYGRRIGCREVWLATEGDNMGARKAYRAAGGIETATDVVLIEFPPEE